MERLVHRVMDRFAKQKLTIIITGDLVENPFTHDGYQQTDPYFDAWRQQGYHILVAPGNHDYGVGFFNWPPCASRFAKHFYPENPTPFPQLQILDNVAYIGLDSNAAELRWYNMWFPNGQLGKKQLQRLAHILENPLVQKAKHRVLYMHHHPNDSGLFMGLKDWAALHTLIDQPELFSAVLFGHRHLIAPKGKASQKPFLHIPRVYDAGASLQKKGYPQGPHRLIDLDAPPDHDIDLHLLSEQ